MKRFIVRLLYSFAFIAYGVFVIGMGDDEPAPIPFTANGNINRAIFTGSLIVGLVSNVAALVFSNIMKINHEPPENSR